MVENMKQIFITGSDWESCYLQLPESKNIKQQILADLTIEIEQRQECFQVGDTFAIDVISHSMAFEMFNVQKITNNSITFTYAGGAS